MIAGRMDREITIQQKSITFDADYGTEVIEWVPLVVASLSPLVGERFAAEVLDMLPSRSEAVLQGLTVARNQTRIRIRWRDDVTSAMRILLHNETDEVYDIVGGPADVDGRKSKLEFVCERHTL